MNRRGFIQSFIGAAVMVALPASGDGVTVKSIKHPILLHDAAHHDLTGGFGLAQAKPEGASIPYDPGLRLNEGLSKMFGDEYQKLKRPADDDDEEV